MYFIQAEGWSATMPLRHPRAAVPASRGLGNWLAACTGGMLPARFRVFRRNLRLGRLVPRLDHHVEQVLFGFNEALERMPGQFPKGFRRKQVHGADGFAGR